MHTSIITYNPNITDLNINLDNIAKRMGYNDHIPEMILFNLKDVYNEIRKIVNLKCGFSYFDGVSSLLEKNAIKINEAIFYTEKIITRQIRELESVCVFAATIGADFDNYSKHFFSTSDALSGYLADLIGSEIAESLTDWLEVKIIELAIDRDLGNSNRYSPGYCGWDVNEQHKLFSLLPKNFLGIILTDSALMQPIKSVSGIIALGKKIMKKAYQCNICEDSFCYKRSM